MDSKLIDLFREKVNDNGADFVLHRYRNINGKNQWSIICSAMDWISVVVDEIDENVARSANNIPGVKLLDARRVNVYDILNSDKLIMTEAAIKSVEEVLG